MSREHLGSLVDAVVMIGDGLDLQSTLRRIVEAAMALSGARYGAMGVFGNDGRLEQFIPVGPDTAETARIGRWPEGKDLLGPVSCTGLPLRLDDMPRHPEPCGLPPGHPPVRSFLGVPVRVRGEAFANLYLTDKRGGDRFDQTDESAVTAFAAAAGAAVENARLYERVHHRELGLRASEEVTTRLLRGEEPDRVLLHVVERACLMAEADVAAIAAPDGSGRNLAVRAASGAGAAELLERTIAAEGSLTGRAYLSGEPVITDISSEPTASPLFGDMGIGPVLLIPLGGGSGARGVLCMGRRPGAEQFPPAAARILHTFVGHATIALELAEARADTERLILLEDRDRIARQMHDTVIQKLSAVALSLSGVTDRAGTPLVSERVRRAVDDIDDTIGRIRSTIFALAGPDSAQEHRWLRDRVMDEVCAAADSLGFTPEVTLEGALDHRVPDRVAVEAVAVLREVLSNVAQDAAADRTAVLVAVNGGLKVEVVDDGAGASQVDRRAGLRALSERTAGLGGTFDVGTAPEGGTVVTWTVPISGEDAPPPPRPVTE